MSCLSNLSDFFGCVSKHGTGGDLADVELQKAFDKIPCSRLLTKFSSDGIRFRTSNSVFLKRCAVVHWCAAKSQRSAIKFLMLEMFY